MSVQAGMTDAGMTVILDIRYPQAYLALRPAMAFARDRGIRCDWLPHSVATLKAPEVAREDDGRGVRHKRFRALQIAREIEVYAEVQGLVLRDFYRRGDSSPFNLGWLWMRHHHREQLETYLNEAFCAYWSISFDPADKTDVADLIESLSGEHGGDERGSDDRGQGSGERFRAWSQAEGPAILDALADELRTHGVFGVPSYLVEGEIFLGRQHLPMIDWIRSGRTGRIPI